MLALLAPAATLAAPARPHIQARFISFGAKRKQEMAAYARRHYGIDSYSLVRPHVIVEHFTANDSIQATINTFAPDNPDVELHELPQVCSHFVIGADGTIVQMVPLGLMCRHTVGLNHTAIGIEHVGRSDSQVLGDRRQMSASLRLTSYLRCRFRIDAKNVIGHAESLSSPYHRENVASLKHQTHGDMARPAMQRYRARLRALGSC